VLTLEKGVKEISPLSLMPTESDQRDVELSSTYVRSTDEEEEPENEEEEAQNEEEEPATELTASAKAEIAQRVLDNSICRAERELHEAQLLVSHNNVLIAYGW
jgi:hypothetical protein